MSRPDFAQKLLSDLKKRKERMGRSSTNMSADAYRDSKRILKGSSTDMKLLAKNNRTKAEPSNQIVPYGTKQPLDMSMTLSYALDDNGKLKKMNLTGSNAMIGFLTQISKRTMDFGNMERSVSRTHGNWPSNAQFPTLTHYHIDEVSKGAQRLNQILKTFYNGVSSMDAGKELLKGAMQLEESLRMLVSLQEASEQQQLVIPKRKSRVKLLEMGEENEEESDKKRMDRPVFSFDRRGNNGKKAIASHRRSVSCDVDTKSAGTKPAGISNVVAKLMGLEEIPRNVGERKVVGNRVAQSNNVLDRIVSERMSIGPHLEIEEGRMSNKIVILASKESDERKPRWGEREREQIMSQIMQLSRKSGGEEFREQSMGRKESVGVKEQKIVSKESGNERRVVSKVQEKYKKLEPKSSKIVVSKGASKKVEAVEEDPSVKDIYEVKSTQGKEDKGRGEMVLKGVLSERRKERAILKPRQDVKLHQEKAKSQPGKLVKSGSNRKANEEMAKLGKPRPSRAVKQEASILQGLKKRQKTDNDQDVNFKMPFDQLDQPLMSVKDEDARPQTIEEVQAKEQSTILQGLKQRQKKYNDQDVNLKMPCDQLDQPLMSAKDEKPRPQTIEVVQAKEIQQPLTNDEIKLKQILITSEVFLNTAEALFKLNIPIGILNLSDSLCVQEKGAKQVTDCAYEMLKMKGKRRELVLYPCKNRVISDMKVRSFDDLVRQLHKDLESLRNYGKTGKSEFDEAEYLLKMLERDMQHKEVDLNCMWDMGWKKTVFGYVEMDEVIRDVEKCVINELLDDVLVGFMEFSPCIMHGENMRNGDVGVTAC